VRSFRIAMVAACPFPAAFASSGLVRELSIALINRGHKVDVFTYHLGDNNFNTDKINIYRIPQIPAYRKLCSGISIGKPFLDILLCQKLMKTCKKNEYDIIHAHNYEAPPAAYYVRKKYKIPVVYHAHNTMFHELPTYFRQRSIQSAARWLGKWMDKTIPHKADHIVTVSEEQTAYLKSSGISDRKLTTIPPCINPELFQNGNGAGIRNMLRIGTDPVILYTGGLQPYQNCGLLIDLLKSCLKEIPDIHMIVLARSAPEWLQDKARIAGVHDRIHFLQGQGMKFEKDCLAAADVGVIPRLNCIGFPVKLLNYLAADLPVVCFEGLNKGFRSESEILAVSHGDGKAMASAIINLIQNRSQANILVKNGQRILKKNHSWNQAVDKLEQIYNQLTSKSARSLQ